MNIEAIYAEYKNMVYNLALHYTQHAPDAEEITQDVFVSVYHSLHAFRNQSKLSTWIYRIAMNKSIDFLKSKQRQKRFAFLTSLYTRDGLREISASAHFDHPGVQLEHKEELAKLFQCINALPLQQRTALILHKIEQKSQTEAAEIMEISVKALESLVQRAKVNLLKQIHQQSEG